MKKMTMLGMLAVLLLSAAMVACSHGSEANSNVSGTDDRKDNEAVTEILISEDYGAKGDGTADDTAAFTEALADIGEKAIVIRITKGTYLIEGRVDFPKNVTLSFDNGAIISVGKSGEVILNCAVEGAAIQIFDGDGVFSGNSASVAYPEWFGASADGSDVTKAIQKAVDIFAEVHLPARSGSYKFGGIRINKPVSVIGTGSLRVGVSGKKGIDLFVIASGDVTVKNLYVTGASGSVDNAVFYFDTSETDISNITIDNVYGTENGYFVKDAGLGKHTVSNFKMTSCTINLNRNTTIYIKDFADNISFIDVVADNVPNGTDISYPGWYMENVTGMFMDNVDAAGGLGKGEGGDGFVFVNCKNVRVERAMQDYVNGIGLKLVGCSEMNFSNFVCSLYEKQAIYMENVTDSVFEMIKANGIYPTINVQETRGEVFEAITLKNCNGLTFNNLTVQYNQADGLIIDGSTDITVNSYVFWGNNGDAYIEKGISDRNTLNGAVSCTNYKSDARFIQCGESSVIRGLVINYTYRDPISGAAEIS